MTNLNFTSNRYTATINTSNLTSDRTIKIPDKNGTIATKEELDSVLNSLNNKINNSIANISDTTFTDPKINELKTINGRLLKTTKPFNFYIGNSERCIFTTLEECLKYLSRYDIASNINTNSILGVIEDGTNFGNCVILNNVNLHYIIFQGETSDTVLNINNPTGSTVCLQLLFYSCFKIRNIKIKYNITHGFIYCTEYSYIRMDNVVLEGTITGHSRYLLYGAWNSTIQCLKCKITHTVKDFKPASVSKYIVIAMSPDSALTFNSGLDVTFNNCSNIFPWLIVIETRSFLNISHNNTNNANYYIDLKAVNTEFSNDQINYIVGSHGSRIELPGLKIKPISIDKLRSVISLYENATANCTDIINLETKVVQSNNDFAFFRVDQGSHIATFNTTVAAASKNTRKFNIAANTVTHNGIITSNN